MGIVAAGGVAVLMNAWWGSEELGWALKDCGATLAVTDAPRGALAREADANIPVIVARDTLPEGQGFSSFADVIEGKQPLVWPDVALATDDTAMMLYTSGSTGFPKGAYSDHRAVIGVLFNWIVVALALKMLGRTNPDPEFQPIMMVAVPFFHVTGLLPVMLVSAVVGRKLVLMYKWDVEEAFKLVETEGVTSFTGVPTMSYEMAASPLRENYDLSSLTDIGGGGAARPPEHVKLIAEAFKGSSPGIGYGLTETNALGALLSGVEYMERPTSTGKPTPPMVQVKIAGPDGKPLPSGERGEICIKSVVNAIGYWNNPEATDRAFKDGWFHTGDVGYLDEEGYLYIVDRMKDIIIRGGENISTLEVEGVLHSHKSVSDVMVVSLPCPRLGEIVGAIVVPANGSFDPAKLLADASEHLAKFKLPEKIWVREEPMPLIASGKIDRNALKEQYRNLWEAEQKETN
jgi:acyl-CoA synthetase (AMP-forming)/AMP-acid ligase II